MHNLLVNALDYSPGDAPVVLSLRDGVDAPALVFDIADQGPGIDPDLQGRLFVRGSRGRDAAHRHGAGLGLYVVGRVAVLHAGQVTERANTPRGSVFSMTIPQRVVR